VVLHHFNFKKPVRDIKFSPDGKYVHPLSALKEHNTNPTMMDRYIAVTHEAHIQVWCTPNHLVREFAPFDLHRVYTGHHDEAMSIQWGADSK
jgi:periodic tryptophan protein 2